MSTPNTHALLSASSAHRWLNCTAAPLFEAQFPQEPPSEYAQEGTLAHEICELYARQYFDNLSVTTRKRNSALKKFKENLEKLKEKPLYADEMLHTAQFYLDYLKDKALSFENAPHVAFEVKVDFSEYVPCGFGTCDSVMIGGGRLHITDYKHGKGVAVSSQGNPQMRLYALGALNRYGFIFGDSIKEVSMAICQPRITDDVTEDVLSVDELKAWGESIKPLADKAYNGQGEFNPGEHCRFCRGRAQCRARAEQNTALEEFKSCVPVGEVPESQRDIPSEARSMLNMPPILSDAEVGDLLNRGKSLVSWYEDLQKYAVQAILDGRDVTGWKVVEGRSNRAFTNTDEALSALQKEGYDEALLYERKPKTLTELEKTVGKSDFAAILADYIIKPPGKPTLAPQSDKRLPYSPASVDFREAATQ